MLDIPQCTEAADPCNVELPSCVVTRAQARTINNINAISLSDSFLMPAFLGGAGPEKEREDSAKTRAHVAGPECPNVPEVTIFDSLPSP